MLRLARDSARAPWRYTLHPTDEPGMVALREYADDAVRKIVIPLDVLRALVAGEPA